MEISSIGVGAPLGHAARRARRALLRAGLLRLRVRAGSFAHGAVSPLSEIFA